MRKYIYTVTYIAILRRFYNLGNSACEMAFLWPRLSPINDYNCRRFCAGFASIGGLKFNIVQYRALCIELLYYIAPIRVSSSMLTTVVENVCWEIVFLYIDTLNR